MKVHVVGPGSIGSLLAFHLKRSSAHSLVLHRRRPPPFASSTATCSIRITPPGALTPIAEPGFELEWPVPAASNAHDSDTPIDALIVATKAQHVFPSLERLKSRLSRASTLFILCNGLPSVLSLVTNGIFPSDNCPSLIVGHTSHGVYKLSESNMTEPCHGAWKHVGAGRLVCSVWPRPSEDVVEHPASLAELKGALQACRQLGVTFTGYQEWLHGALAKLAVNCAVNAATALIGGRNGALLAPSARDFITAVLREVAAVFAVELAEETPSALPSTLLPTHPLAHQMLLQTTLEVLSVTRDNTSSTLSDVLRLTHPQPPEMASSGPYTELEHLNGYINKLGRKHNIPTPLNDALGALVETKCQVIAARS